MKYLCVVLIFFSSMSLCSKKVESQIKNELIGKWKWVESSGGFAGRIQTPETTQKEIILEFTSEKCIKYVNGKVESNLNYMIEKGPSIRTTEDTYLIIYENDKKQSVDFIDNKLILYDECHDCFQNEYIKTDN
ncbi:MAG: hypothetical protein KQH79_17585 [Bacteroidetes bacterium]|nr:hypothetical protein [Bacteroidota bacterium]